MPMIPTPVPVDPPSPLSYTSPSVTRLGRGPVAQGLMGPLVAVEPEVGVQVPTGLCGVGVWLSEVHLVVLYGSPGIVTVPKNKLPEKVLHGGEKNDESN